MEIFCVCLLDGLGFLFKLPRVALSVRAFYMRIFVLALTALIGNNAFSQSQGGVSSDDVLLKMPIVSLILNNNGPFTSFEVSGDLTLTKSHLLFTPRVYWPKRYYRYNDLFIGTSIAYDSIKVMRRKHGMLGLFGKIVIKTKTQKYIFFLNPIIDIYHRIKPKGRNKLKSLRKIINEQKSK